MFRNALKSALSVRHLVTEKNHQNSEVRVLRSFISFLHERGHAFTDFRKLSLTITKVVCWYVKASEKSGRIRKTLKTDI